jgi:hypothetical protein
MGLENGAEDVSDGRRPMPKPRHLFAPQNSSHQPSSNNNNNNNDKKYKNDRDSINNDNNEVGPNYWGSDDLQKMKKMDFFD